jgi:flagellin
MALTVATNTGALMAQAAASSVNKEMEISMERLSTGKRINGASDDAAGVAIASRLSAEIKGTNQAIRNAMDGQALIDTAEGAHSEVEAILQRMRELAVQSANETNSSSDRTSLQTELDQLVQEIDRISATTSWAGINLLDGSDTDGFSFQVGSRGGETNQITATINSTSSTALGVSSSGAVTFSNITETATTSNKPIISAVDNQSTNAEFAFDENVLDISTYNADADLRFSIDGNAIVADFESAQSASTNYIASALGLGQFIVDKITAAGIDGITATFDGTDKVTIAKAGTTNSLATTATAGQLNVASRDAGETISVDIDGKTVSMTVAASGYTADVTGVAAQLRDTINNNNELSGYTATSSAGVVTVTKGAIASLTVANGAASHASAAVAIDGLELDFTHDNSSLDDTYSADIDGVTVTVSNQEIVDMGFAANLAAIVDDSVAKGFNQKMLDANLNGISGNFTATSGSLILSKTAGVSITTMDAASAALATIDAALETIALQRANLGSVSNRLDSTVSNLTNISSNLQAGRGRIEDADFAAETTSLAKSQILQQASTAMLAQANASKQNVLSLLQG